MTGLGVLLGLLTFCVSLIVAMVGYAQSRTANQKVVLDLHDRRLKVYGRIEEAVSLVIRHGRADDETFTAFARGQAEASFIFGSDVLEYLQSLRKDFAFLNTYTVATIQQSPNNAALFQQRTDTMLRIGAVFNDGFA
jgi:hypothetical protein